MCSLFYNGVCLITNLPNNYCNEEFAQFGSSQINGQILRFLDH